MNICFDASNSNTSCTQAEHVSMTPSRTIMGVSYCWIFMALCACLVTKCLSMKDSDVCNMLSIEQDSMQTTGPAINISFSPITADIMPIPGAPNFPLGPFRVAEHFYSVTTNCKLVLYLNSDQFMGSLTDLTFPVTCNYLNDSKLPDPTGQILKLGQASSSDDLPELLPRSWKEANSIIAKMIFPLITGELDNIVYCSANFIVGTMHMTVHVKAIGCPNGKFGPRCLENCTCQNQATCHTFLGYCMCLEGFTGDRCQTWIPKADITPTQLTVPGGVNVTFECDFHPKPWGRIKTVVWLYEGSTLENGSSTRISDRYLQLTELTPARSGQYRCTAYDDTGISYSAVATLNVLTEQTEEASADSVFVTLFVVSTVLLCVLLAVFVVSIIVFLHWRKKRRTDQSDQQMQIALGHQNTYVKTGNQIEPCLSDQEIRFNLIFSDWELKKHQISKGDKIGSGEFSDVFAAELRWPGLQIRAAVKIPKDSEDLQPTHDLTFEFLILTDVCPHPNLVQLLGLYKDVSCTNVEKRCLVMEYMDGGNLLSWLHKQRENLSHLESGRLGNIMLDVLCGMLQLSKYKVIHRDLSSRNILLTAERSAKIGDFGLARETYTTGAYHLNLHSEQRLPWLWMAPETLANGEYSDKSDMWSFGILLWEVVSLGAVPYPGVSTVDLLEFLQSGRRMMKPSFPLRCSDAWFGVMEQCWEEEPCRRPEITETFECFSKWQQHFMNFPEIADDSRLEKYEQNQLSVIHLDFDDATLDGGQTVNERHEPALTRRKGAPPDIAAGSPLLPNHQTTSGDNSYIAAKYIPNKPAHDSQASRTDYSTAVNPQSLIDDVYTKLGKPTEE